MGCVLATTTWNSIDLIDLFLRHYRKLGVDRIMVMDYDSEDGTRDVLDAREWQGFVERVPFPGLARLDSSNIFLGLAKAASDEWALFCDPDELLVTPSMTIREPAVLDALATAEWLSIPRFNVTAPRSVAETDEASLSAQGALTLRIDGRHSRQIDIEIHRARLEPAWIFTAIPGKVLTRVDAAVAVGEGDHVMRTATDHKRPAPEGVYLLHYPFRRYAAFCRKLEMAQEGFEANPHLSQGHGWQIRRWIRMAHAEGVREEYLQQFIPDDALPALLAAGALTHDDSVQRLHRAAAGFTHQGGS